MPTNSRRRDIILNLDINGFIELMQRETGKTPTREAAEIALHKLRIRPEFNAPGHLKTESHNWLYGRGYNADI